MKKFLCQIRVQNDLNNANLMFLKIPTFQENPTFHEVRLFMPKTIFYAEIMSRNVKKREKNIFEKSDFLSVRSEIPTFRQLGQNFFHQIWT